MLPRVACLRSIFKPNQFVIALALSWLVFTGAIVEAQTTSTWIGDVNDNWYDAENWDPAVVPNDSFIRRAIEVVIDGEQDGVADVRLSESATTVIGSLSIGAGDSLRLESDRFDSVGLSIQGFFVPDVQSVLSNQGTIAVVTDINLFSSESFLVLSDNISLSGGGTIDLTSSELSFTNSFLLTAEVTNVDNQIQGSGLIDVTNVDIFTNSAAGTIVANQSGNSLSINDRREGIDFSNEGTLRADNGGVLGFNIEVSNSTGTIEALDGSTILLLDRAGITGGTLSASGSGTVEVSAESGSQITTSAAAQVTFRDLLLDANVNVQEEASLNLQGTIDNRKSITAVGVPNFFDTPDSITITGNTTLTGNGTIDLDEAGIGLIGRGPNSLTNMNNTIQGSGSIAGDFINEADGLVVANRQFEELVVETDFFNQTITNSGTFRAENGGILRLRGGIDDGVINEGTIEALDDSFVSVGNVTGGILRSVGTGGIGISGKISNLTLDGSATVFGESALEGEIVNRGDIELIEGSFLDTSLAIRGGVTLSGGGTVRLNSSSPFNPVRIYRLR